MDDYQAYLLVYKNKLKRLNENLDILNSKINHLVKHFEKSIDDNKLLSSLITNNNKNQKQIKELLDANQEHQKYMLEYMSTIRSK